MTNMDHDHMTERFGSDSPRQGGYGRSRFQVDPLPLLVLIRMLSGDSVALALLYCINSHGKIPHQVYRWRLQIKILEVQKKITAEATPLRYDVITFLKSDPRYITWQPSLNHILTVTPGFRDFSPLNQHYRPRELSLGIYRHR